jgi:uncharacterized protein (DUF1015 family)
LAVAEVRPFRGLRYVPERVGDLSDVVCPPYDVITPDEAMQLRAANPYNAVRLELPEGSPEETSPDSRYAAAARTLRDWRVEGVLAEGPRPALYVVEERFDWEGQQRRRRGVLAVVRLADWSEAVVLPHERTLSGPKADRLALLRACAANFSPVFLLHAPHPAPEALLWGSLGEAPALEVCPEPGYELRFWSTTEEIDDWCGALVGEPLYVADGHHRFETALRYRDDRRATAGPEATRAAYNYALSYLVSMDDPGLLVLPTHRCLPADSFDGGRLETLVTERFDGESQPLPGTDPAALRRLMQALARRGEERSAFVLYRRGDARLLTMRAGAERWLAAGRAPAWRALDVARLESLLLEPLLGPAAPELLSYTRSAAEAIARVDAGDAGAAVLLNPTPPRQIAAVAEAAERMPQKSTYFYPKLPTGLVFHALDGASVG